MVSQKVTINNPQGLHMRPAGVFAKGMAKFDSDVTINFNGKATNGKSLLNIIGACIKCGSEVEIQCDGRIKDCYRDDRIRFRRIIVIQNLR